MNVMCQFVFPSRQQELEKYVDRSFKSEKETNFVTNKIYTSQSQMDEIRTESSIIFLRYKIDTNLPSIEYRNSKGEKTHWV